jgi:hypothetical protein
MKLFKKWILIVIVLGLFAAIIPISDIPSHYREIGSVDYVDVLRMKKDIWMKPMIDSAMKDGKITEYEYINMLKIQHKYYLQSISVDSIKAQLREQIAGREVIVRYLKLIE